MRRYVGMNMSRSMVRAMIKVGMSMCIRLVSGSIVLSFEKKLTGLESNNIHTSMKDEKISNTNTKGQLVIPPVKAVIPDIPNNNVYRQVLESTVGSWRNDTYEETIKKRQKLELEASRKRKKEW